MSNIPKTFTEKIKNIYKKSGYLDNYGGSLIITVVVLFIFWLIIFISSGKRAYKTD